MQNVLLLLLLSNRWYLSSTYLILQHIKTFCFLIELQVDIYLATCLHFMKTAIAAVIMWVIIHYPEAEIPGSLISEPKHQDSLFKSRLGIGIKI